MALPPIDDAPHPADDDDARPALRVVSRLSDHQSELAYLGAVILDPAALDHHPVTPESFDHAGYGRIVRAALALRARGSDVDTISLRAHLIDSGEFARVGDDLLLELTTRAPIGSEAGSAAERILKLAALRSARESLRSGMRSIERGELPTADLREALERLSPKSRAVSPADRARGLGLRGVRLETGLPSLDEATRGGLLSGRVVVLGGAPGAGKTTLALQLGRRYARAGHAVMVLAADEDADGLLIRWGQSEGLVRDDLEAGHDGARRYLAEQVEALAPRLGLLDAEDDGSTVESAASALMRMQTDGSRVLIVDSIQTARAAGADDADSPRERIDCVIRALKTASRGGALVIATSEMARGYYRSRSSGDATSALASGKESGAIEYAAAMMLALRSVPEEADLVDVGAPKNRLGRATGDAPLLRLRLDRDRATFSETALPVDDGPGESKDARRALSEAADAAELVMAVRRSSVPVVGQHSLRALAPGGSARKRAAVGLAIAKGWIEGGGRTTPFTVTDRAPKSPEPRDRRSSEPDHDDEWGGQ